MNTQNIIMVSVILVKLLSSGFLLLFGKSIGRFAKWISLLVSFSSLGLFLIFIPALQNGEIPSVVFDYFPTMGIQFSLKIDWLAFPLSAD